MIQIDQTIRRSRSTWTLLVPTDLFDDTLPFALSITVPPISITLAAAINKTTTFRALRVEIPLQTCALITRTWVLGQCAIFILRLLSLTCKKEVYYIACLSMLRRSWSPAVSQSKVLFINRHHGHRPRVIILCVFKLVHQPSLLPKPVLF